MATVEAMAPLRVEVDPVDGVHWCPWCSRWLNGSKGWKDHRKGNMHRKALRAERRALYLERIDLRTEVQPSRIPPDQPWTTVQNVVAFL